ncbi:MAG: peptidoglycan DD-metalloendopeptidase family protein [Actinomycetota bacterium]|nr:peptidoglycan DD-metalloendopeptidase family protein [Actinomycetota bacterium]
MRRQWPMAMVLMAALAAPPAATAHVPDDDRLERIERKIGRAEDRIERAERRREGVLSAIEDSDRRRAEHAGQIEDLNGRLEQAERRLDVLRAALDLARDELDRSTRRLKRTRRSLIRQQSQLNARAAAAYKAGPGAYLDVILGSEDLHALASRAAFIDRLLVQDTYLVEGIEFGRTLVAGHRRTIGDIEKDLADRTDAMQAEVDRIEGIKAEQEALRAEIEHEIAGKREILADIEAEKEKYLEAVADLEAQSARIAASIQGSGSTGSGEVRGGQLQWPTDGGISSGYGWRVHPIFGTSRFHAGVDIGAGCGQPIYAADDGTVLSADWSGGYGQLTVVDHGDGLSTAYAHQSEFGVSGGEQVSRGETIGYVGTTGWSTGCHLHFEVRINGEHTDPAPYIT